MNLLSLDTSTKNFSLAVSNGKKILARKSVRLDKALSESIIPAVTQMLKKTKLSLKQLDGFVVGLGPGSFTSLRVGVSTVKAFALVTTKPVVGISSLDAIAQGLKDDGRVCVIRDARRSLVYACSYQKGNDCLKRKSDYLLISISDLLSRIQGEIIFVGDGIVLYKKQIEQSGQVNSGKITAKFADETFWLPQAHHFIPLALERFQKAQTDDISKLVPLYLYPEDCQVQR